jgi:hypothetical protein
MKNFFKIDNIDDLEKSGVLYSIENTITGDKYAGVTMRKLKDRLKQHAFMHSKHNSSSPNNRTSFYSDLNSIDISNFKVTVLHQSQDRDLLFAMEKEIQKGAAYEKYTNKDIVRDRTRKRIYNKIICVNGDEVLEFPTPIACAKFFNCDRTNVLRAIKGEYKLKRKFKVTFQ